MEIVRLGKTHGELILQHPDYRSLENDFIHPSSNLKLRGRAIVSVFEPLIQQAGNNCEPNISAWVKWQQIECFPAVYDKTMENATNNTLNNKVKISVYCLPIKNTSQLIEYVTIDMLTEKPLFWSTVLQVRVDMTPNAISAGKQIPVFSGKLYFPTEN